tara:strand:- start:893 stop:1930 length:1038 start_codon:yes stop_codon:yes gene_type:complete
MATKNIVPRADGEGSLGTTSKGWGGLYVHSGNATSLSKIVLGTNTDKSTIGCVGAADQFFTNTAQGDLVFRADDNNDKIHLGAGTSGIAAMTITEVANVGKVGIGTHVPGVPLEVLDSTATSATQGGNLRLTANDGATMASGHRLGVLEFAGAEDAGGSITVGARIEALTDATWSASENGADLVFYTTDGDASQTEQMRCTASTGVSIPKRKLAVTSSTDGDANGDIVYFGGTTSMTTGAIYHYKSDGTWELADADAVATCDGLLGVALGAASDTNGVLLRGFVTLDHDPGAIGDVLYVSTTAGDCSATAPSATGDVVRIVGYQVSHASNGNVWFNPSSTFVELT